MMLPFKVDWITNLPFFYISMSHKLPFFPDCESNAVINALENELAKAVILRARDHNLKLITSDGDQVSKVITCFNCNVHSSTSSQTTQMILQIELVLHHMVLHHTIELVLQHTIQ